MTPIPCSADASAVAAPIPRLPPVMMTMLMLVCLSGGDGCECDQVIESRQRIRYLGVDGEHHPLHADARVSGDDLCLRWPHMHGRHGHLAAREFAQPLDLRSQTVG